SASSPTPPETELLLVLRFFFIFRLNMGDRVVNAYSLIIIVVWMSARLNVSSTLAQGIPAVLHSSYRLALRLAMWTNHRSSFNIPRTGTEGNGLSTRTS